MSRRWIGNSLLLLGVAAIDVWIWSNAITTIVQIRDNWIFDHEKSTDHAAPAAPPRMQNNAVIGRLTIPRLRIHAMVREGAGERTLSLALGHIPSTSLPGQPGNVGIAGHRDTLFRSLGKIRKSDLILFQTRGGRYAYRVESTRIVKPRDVDVLEPGRHSQLTLVTCYPFYYVGSAPDRFIVKARQVPLSTRHS